MKKTKIKPVQAWGWINEGKIRHTSSRQLLPNYIPVTILPTHDYREMKKELRTNRLVIESQNKTIERLMKTWKKWNDFYHGKPKEVYYSSKIDL